VAAGGPVGARSRSSASQKIFPNPLRGQDIFSRSATRSSE
jgi:hypothetical protein